MLVREIMKPMTELGFSNLFGAQIHNICLHLKYKYYNSDKTYICLNLSILSDNVYAVFC